MSKATTTVFAGVALLTCAWGTGCAEGGHGRGGHGSGSSFPTEALAVAAVAVAEAAAVAALPAPVADPDPNPDPYIGVWAGPPSAAIGSANHTDFEPAAALSAIDALDFGVCRSSGTLIGWNHARLTFERDGAVTRVEIDGAAGMPPAAIECIKSELATVSAPKFEGPPVTIGAAFFVP